MEAIYHGQRGCTEAEQPAAVRSTHLSVELQLVPGSTDDEHACHTWPLIDMLGHAVGVNTGANIRAPLFDFLLHLHLTQGRLFMPCALN